ncbi:VOC family protein [Virgibacillus sp. NKC19-3]|uniref:VOC family protein n=1 Tax=Virgibacillus saliphilus TaxID=2831674 RepID=UPI001C9A8ECE|nr:VOC family protein [Virgibacillus sp. NKC19-3]MBY7141884.1 VOC family protein [Virgibacillus sp. NKC19-3]
MSMLESVDTVCLGVSNIMKAKQWYSEKLGLKVVFQEHNYAVLSLGDSSIPLTIEEKEVVSNNAIYPIFYTSNIEETHQNLSEKGVKLTEIVSEGSNTFFDVFDLDGNKMQVCFY